MLTIADAKDMPRFETERRPAVFFTIDHVVKEEMSNIYCKCGSIVSLDRRTVKLKKHLRKDVECPVCRNFRISNEIEHMNCLFEGTLDADPTV
ncbi:MAG: hypothetical protein LBH69_02605 [Methanomassiliicoccaceae archaeon]|nr:hypothetical protein [Methanomassiliicoccaceae archaeon]